MGGCGTESVGPSSPGDLGKKIEAVTQLSGKQGEEAVQALAREPYSVDDYSKVIANTNKASTLIFAYFWLAANHTPESLKVLLAEAQATETRRQSNAISALGDFAKRGLTTAQSREVGQILCAVIERAGPTESGVADSAARVIQHEEQLQLDQKAMESLIIKLRPGNSAWNILAKRCRKLWPSDAARLGAKVRAQHATKDGSLDVALRILER